jgi:hypothetical protein
MSNYLTCMDIVIQLPDKRILLYKSSLLNHNKWNLTIEHTIKSSEISFGYINSVLCDLFKIDYYDLDKKFSEIKQYPLPNCTNSVNIELYIAKLKSSISFKTKPENKFIAMPWKTLLKDIMKNSICNDHNCFPKHTLNAIKISRELHNERYFDL